jgi:hypothetical protein
MKTLLGCLIVSKTVRFFGLVRYAGIVIERFHEPASIPAAIVGNIVRAVRGLNFVAPGGVRCRARNIRLRGHEVRGVAVRACLSWRAFWSRASVIHVQCAVS